MDRYNPNLDFMEVLSSEFGNSLSFDDIVIFSVNVEILDPSTAEMFTAQNALMDLNVGGRNKPTGSSTDEILSSFQKILRELGNRNSKFQRTKFQVESNYLDLTAETLANNDIYYARVHIIPLKSEAVNRLIIQCFVDIFMPTLKYNFNGTDHIYTSQNVEHEKRYLISIRIRHSVIKDTSMFVIYFENEKMFSTKFKNNESVLLRTIKTSILLSDDDSKFLMNFDFLLSSYFDRHSDPSLITFWENVVLNWKPIKTTDNNYELLEKHLSDRFNFDLNSEMDEINFQKVSDYLKQLKILNMIPNDHNVMQKCMIVGLIKTGNALRIEYNDFGEILQSDSITNYYVNKSNYTLQHQTLPRYNPENKMFSILPTKSCAFGNRAVQLGNLTDRTRKVIQIISGLTDDQYRMLQNTVQAEKYKHDLNLNQLFYQNCQQQ